MGRPEVNGSRDKFGVGLPAQAESRALWLVLGPMVVATFPRDWDGTPFLWFGGGFQGV